MKEISFPPAQPKNKKRMGMFIRLRPEFFRAIKNTAKAKKMTQVHFIETCVALHGKEARPGLTFRFEVVNPNQK